MTVFNCRGRILDLSEPIVMGILNITPDSFYVGSRIQNIDDAIARTEKMISEGATFIDIGAMSSRPGAKFVSVEEELKRLLPIFTGLRNEFPDIFFSVDTFRSEVASQVLEEGADIINDISAGTIDPKILDIVAKHKTPYIFMHMKGTPMNMQDNPQYRNVTEEILKFTINKIRYFRLSGIEQLICDPGFGFGKTLDDNYRLLNELEVFGIFEVPLLAGISRKSMIYKFLNISPEDSLNATSALHMITLQKGTKILRVHDVKEAVEVVKLYNKIKEI